MKMRERFERHWRRQYKRLPAGSWLTPCGDGYENRSVHLQWLAYRAGFAAGQRK